MKIYTKNGDGGTSELFAGPTVSKSDPRLEAYGTIDELSSAIGICISQISLLDKDTLRPINIRLAKAQNYLFTIGSHLALGDPGLKDKIPPLTRDEVSSLEEAIDKMDKQLPKLKEFILPGGSPASSYLNLARTICRRSERRIVTLNDSHRPAEILQYINRLSDYLFVAARFCNYVLKISETAWKKQ